MCPFFVPGDNVLSVRKLNELLQPLIEELGYEFVGLEYNSNPKHALLRIYIDHESGVGIEDCEVVSRETAALLDVKDPIRSQYNLEVSSPGLDRPMFRSEHYIEFIGSPVQINTFAPLDGRRKFSGPILGADEHTVTIDQDGSEVTLEIDNIVKAKLIPDYKKILAGHKTK
jgi:ribosome maturation factor RimP